MSVIVLQEQLELVNDQATLKLIMVSRHDVDTSAAVSKDVDYAALNGLYGELDDHCLYLASASSKTFVYIYNLDKIRKKNRLDLDDMGVTHLEFFCGGILTGSLLSSKFSKSGAVVELCMSDDLRSNLSLSEYFISGLRLKSVSNDLRLDKKSKEISKTRINLSKLVDEKIIEKSNHMVESMIITKSLVNTPANYLNPESYESFARQETARLAGAGKPVTVEVFDRSKLENDGAGLILAVGKASQYAPRIIKLSYRPKNAQKTLALVGKGITYDSGGLNLKPGATMRDMKKDMGGSAAVYGTFLHAVLNEAPINIDAYLSVAENMVAGNAFRPGDVYVALNGTSVEIDNTDAEGRLVLADALTYADREKPDFLIDVATLTGAARISLGTQIDFCVTNNKKLAEELDLASVETGDWAWRQPLVKSYKSSLDSKVATMENGGSRFGGAITAALFLDTFHENKNWLHIDTWMWSEKPNFLTKESGATPKTILLLSKIIERIA